MSKTLYLTDLDGTLLGKDRTVSPFTEKTVQELIGRGVLFSYATARSVLSAAKVIGNICPEIPVICFNGTFLCDHRSGRILEAEHFTDEQHTSIRRIAGERDLSPLAFSLISGEEKVSRMPGLEDRNEGVRYYLDCHPGDERQRTAASEDDLYGGEIFTYTFIGTKEELRPAAEIFRGLRGINVTFFQELDRPEWWCNLTPEKGQKSHAAQKLKKLLGYDRIVCFGDGINDLPLFGIADECYAVENAVPELKAAACGIIPSNEKDGVARWLSENAHR